jgi:protein-arginine kinase activator protein McsA
MEWTMNNTGENYRDLFKMICDIDAISILEEQLKQAETTEDYELCCELRDMITELKN